MPRYMIKATKQQSNKATGKTLHSIMQPQHTLDQIFLLDSAISIIFGCLSLVTPHRLIFLVSGGYNHGAHETLRLYGCLRIAVGWILYNVRNVDDGRFRRSVCEALCACYFLQSVVVLRAQMTDTRNWINWIALIVLTALCFVYGKFRFGNEGTLIKIYELPSKSSRISR